MQKINKDFLYELFKLMFRKRDVLEVCIEHLKFEHLPDEKFKNIFASCKKHYLMSQTLPTFGIISQQHSTNVDTLACLDRINAATVLDKDAVLLQLESYIKDQMSLKFYDDFASAYNKGDRDGARNLLSKQSEDLAAFSLRSSKSSVTRLWADYQDREVRRIFDRESLEVVRKIPLSIDEIDALIHGGIDVGETACFMTRSGVGKTKFLRWVGVGAARRGSKVLHIQAEGSKKNCEDGYDATWTGMPSYKLNFENAAGPKAKELRDLASLLKTKGGEIYIYSFEQFGMASMRDVRKLILDVEKIVGKIDLVIIDYLELFHPGDGRKYGVDTFAEKARREAVAEKMKNIAVEFETRIVTATQANDIPPELFNDPNYVMTRHNVSMAKGLPNSFSYFFTGNQTSGEYDANMIRIYLDKLRFVKSGQIVTIYQKYDHDRFYDRKRTLLELHGKEVS